MLVSVAAGVVLAALAGCEFSGTSVVETRVERVVITDQDGRGWDVTQAVVRYGFEPRRFLFGLGASRITPFVLPMMAAPADSGYPAPDDTLAVIGVDGSPPRAYRIADLLDVEVADDTLAGTPFAVVVRPLFTDNDPAVYARVLDGDTLTLSASGWVYDAQSVLFDIESGSMWYRLAGESHLTCIAGLHFTGRLPPRPFTVQPWQQWHGAHPGSLFMLRPPQAPQPAGFMNGRSSTRAGTTTPNRTGSPPPAG